ncbi:MULTISPECIES: dTMP kinase [unclassified Guyparkeria]|uniref:dTMP kinase n=1 Tax=unclassified Guyparkeria TaxID=2626246 RepID=UPI00073370A8|nr:MULTISPECIES: dTMP kinase [unclassified Guyparkeria]KTG16079.1 thymidylate kinase [Guyparkeria sp. XI15]OAE84930.1 thymidylate kinase [Guyparkeria sp. WRN-7]
MAATNARFITLEGLEGAGKSTAMAFARDWFEARGESVVCTREPGGTPLAEELRGVLKAVRDEPVAPSTELLLMFAARAQHVERVIRPALAEGKVVICDRFTDSTRAYQGAGRGLSMDVIEQLADVAHPDSNPGLTLWLDVPVALGLERAAAREAADRFEQETLDFFERVRGGFETLARREPERVQRIDATRPLAEVQAAVESALEARHGE